MQLLLIGLSHHTTPVDLRERMHLSQDQLFPVLASLKNGSSEILEDAILSTCNRLEIYCIVRDVIRAENDIVQYLCDHYQMTDSELHPYLYFKQGRLAVRHLMNVASGLDSMILGESQILGQVSAALECATTVSSSGTLLHRLFEQSLHTGKRARTETAISQNTTSVSHAAVRLVSREMDKPNPDVLLIGAGEMAEVAAQALVDFGMTNISIVNRTYEHGDTLAQKIGGKAYGWSELWDQLAKTDVVISATGAPHVVLYANDLTGVIEDRSGRHLVIVDVAVPRDIDPNVSQLSGITYFDIDDLQQVVDESLAQRKACVPQVQAIIVEEEERYWNWLNERNIVPVIKELRGGIEQVVQTELEEALGKLAHLSESDQEVVRRLAHRIMNKVLHAPTTSLREQAATGNGVAYAEVVRDLFAL